ncbi:MAG: spiro-SPASM protein, partial [Spirochaetales bacterium]|nr:spiro-SPASM protein [Spirochaetales bacterium]
METRAVINATRVNEFAIKPFAGGPGAFERVVAMARSAANGDILVLAGPGLSIPDEKLAADGLTVVRRQSWSMHAALEAMSSFAASAEAGTLVYYQADSPFVDAGLCATLLDLHRRYRAEYTFADGYPPGLAPEVLAAKSLPNLVELASRFDAPSDRDGLFAVIQKDINSYDIETHLSPVDLRGYRFSPVCDSMRNMMAAERLWALGARNADDVVATLPAHPELLRTVPAFLWVQICDGCPQACSYCPYPLMVGDPTNLHSSM